MTKYQTTKYINGPFNVVRLEGKIGNIKKVLYVFFDTHSYSTKCDVKYALNFMQYVIKETKNTNIVYDLFIETRFDNNLTLMKRENEIAENYLMAVIWSFKKLDLSNNKIHNYNDNIRIQFMDWRNFYSLSLVYKYANINTYIDSFDYEYIIDEIDNYTNTINIIIKYFNEIKLMTNNIYNKSIVEYFNDYYNNVESNGYYNDNKMFDHTLKLIWKLYNSYKYKNVKEKINKLIDDYLSRIEKHVNEILSTKKDLEKFTFNEIMLFSKRISQFEEYIIIAEKIEYLSHNILYLTFGLHFELHFIRRFLDKDYITNALSYTGGSHSFYLIHLLIKYFDFKITNIYLNNSNLNIGEINEKISKSEFNINNKILNNDISNIFDENRNQCVNMESFPEKFM